MRAMFWRVLLVSVVLFISVAATSQNMERIPTGVWGGQHIHIEVGEKSARIEYDCANGVIDGPLTVDANKLKDLSSLLTIVDGRIVFERP